MITPERIKDAAASLQTQTVSARRHLHRNPELSFKEKETVAYVAGELQKAGIPCRELAGGVVGLIEGSGGRAVALRADMDALAITELNDVPYRSQNPGLMHACGHDAHTACLLTAGRILAGLRDKLPGTVKLIFQPAEEIAPGGAQAMIREGVLQSPTVESAVGQHVNPEIATGTVGFRSGPFMGSVDDVFITVKGAGGHAAKPHQGTDPVAIASTLVVSLQQIISRNSDPVEPSVLSFGYIHGGGTNNVIPDAVELRGTFRTFDPLWRDEAVRRIKTMVGEIAHAMGGSADVHTVRGYPTLVNDPEVTIRARSRAAEYVGNENVVDLPPALWSEDFAYFTGEIPACFYNLGVRNEAKGIVHPVHTPRFDLDEDALGIGAGLLAWIALGELKQE